MYRCTECHTEYTYCPDFCECGNDTFEEVYDDVQDDYYEEEPERQAPPAKRKLTPEEKKELAKAKREKKKSLIAAGVICVLCILVFILPPHKKPKMEKVKEKVAQEQIKIPSVESYWDPTLPSAFKKKDPLANLPLLNSRFRSISPDLENYLKNIGNDFNRKWDKSIIKGAGECKVEFTVNKEGNVASKRIISTSHNDTLDNSVLLLLSNITGYDIPPDDYKGERIYITFKVNDDGSSYVKFPMK